MTLSIYPATRCYFIEDGVVFKINTDIKSKDSCALPVYTTNEKDEDDNFIYENQDKLDKVTVTKTVVDTYKDNDENERTVTTVTKRNYWLDGFITDGDLYKNSKFSKKIHGESPETELTIPKYFEKKCNDELASYILENYPLSYNEIIKSEASLNRIGIPVWMIQQASTTYNYDNPVDGLIKRTITYTISSNVTKINFTEELYNSLLKEQVQKLVTAYANLKAGYYNYKVSGYDNNKKLIDLTVIE